MMIYPLVLAAMLSRHLPQTPKIALPTERQLAWQKLEMYAFTHFGPNTFTDAEWGHGTEDPNLFNPTDFDARQWAKTFKMAGMKGIIVTAKHHDGFCLWPSKLSTHTVSQSKWRDGKGDVLREISDACKAEGLKFGVYLSPWDRNHPKYGTPEYNQVFASMLKEVLTQYGDVFEVWFDGANGEGPNGKKQVYDWPLFTKTVRQYAPHAVIFSDAGPDIRWVGNESGLGSETSWSTIDRDRYVPGTSLSGELGQGKQGGTHWVPAECDVSIRPGWFYHPEEDSKVKTGAQLVDLYEKSVGRNGSFLLNVPPDRRGRIADADVKALLAMRKQLDATYSVDFARKGESPASNESETTSTQFHRLDGVRLFDRVVLSENIARGQRVKHFEVDAKVGKDWKRIAEGTTIGNKRILVVPPTRSNELWLRVTDAIATPQAIKMSVHVSPETVALNETSAERDERMAWFRDARFGMFIHWGLYAIPAGVWNGKDIPSIGEWIYTTAKIPLPDYEKLQGQFNPVNFDARKWVDIAKGAGMKYIVITSKHHDGFGLWPSKMGEWNVGHSPFKRDPLKELATECRKAGLKMCFYHSIMDWHHPDYLPRRQWDTRDASKAEFDRYVTYMKGQLKELLTNYGPIGIIWFDGEWEGTWTHDRGADLYNFVRKISPKTIVNNRVDKGRGGMAGMSDKGFAGDYGTPEQEIPANGLPGVDWESCMTLNDTWGFKSKDNHWKSSETIIHNLVDCASKGGNYLLNVGPTSLGEIPAPSVEILEQVGEWTKLNGDSVYGTHAGPFTRPLPWGRATIKGNRLFLHVFDRVAGSIELSGLRGQLGRAYMFSDNSPVELRTVNGEPELHFGLRNPSADEVYVVEFTGTLHAEKPAVHQASDGSVNLTADDAAVHGQIARFEADKKAIGFWSNDKDSVHWEFVLNQPQEFRVFLEYACEPASAGATFEVRSDGASLKGTVAATASWSDFKTVEVGTLALVHPGRTALTISPTSMPHGAVMNLRRIVLKPVK